jgi:hypothetical protein
MLNYILSFTGCWIEQSSPQRSEDYLRKPELLLGFVVLLIAPNIVFLFIGHSFFQALVCVFYEPILFYAFRFVGTGTEAEKYKLPFIQKKYL